MKTLLFTISTFIMISSVSAQEQTANTQEAEPSTIDKVIIGFKSLEITEEDAKKAREILYYAGGATAQVGPDDSIALTKKQYQRLRIRMGCGDEKVISTFGSESRACIFKGTETPFSIVGYVSEDTIKVANAGSALTYDSDNLGIRIYPNLPKLPLDLKAALQINRNDYSAGTFTDNKMFQGDSVNVGLRFSTSFSGSQNSRDRSSVQSADQARMIAAMAERNRLAELYRAEDTRAVRTAE